MFCKFGVLCDGRIQKAICALYEFLCDCFLYGCTLISKKKNLWGKTAAVLGAAAEVSTDPGASLEKNIGVLI